MTRYPVEHRSAGAVSNNTRPFSDRALLPSRKALSQFLIAVLLLLSPITFSTDKITNFVYECPLSSTCSVKTSRVVVNQRPAKTLLLDLPSAPLQIYGSCTTPPRPAILICFASPCRAPPA